PADGVRLASRRAASDRRFWSQLWFGLRGEGGPAVGTSCRLGPRIVPNSDSSSLRYGVPFIVRRDNPAGSLSRLTLHASVYAFSTFVPPHVSTVLGRQRRTPAGG